MSLAPQLTEPLFVGELGGEQIPGFDVNNSPAQIASRQDVHRPMILLSTSGTKLIWSAKGDNDVYVACLRNYTAMAQYLITTHSKIAILGAGTRNEFREEDQLCCAWVAAYLTDAGYESQNELTHNLITHWKGAPLHKIITSNSSQYLIKSKQTQDLDFVLTHVDDLTGIYRFEQGRIVQHTMLVSDEAYELSGIEDRKKRNCLDIKLSSKHV